MAKDADISRQEMPAYQLIRSRRRTLALVVRPDRTIEVRSPPNVSRRQIEAFLRERIEWIKERQQASDNMYPVESLPPKEAGQADRLIRERVQELIVNHQLPLPRVIRIKDLVSRWGSCSAKGAISINRRCSCLPPELLDYVILHEFCHLIHLNHSKAFWQLLRQYLPDVTLRRDQIKRYYPAATRSKEDGQPCLSTRSHKQR